MTVFVTGATGFLGRYLVRGLLDQGENVMLLVRAKDRAHGERRIRNMLAWFEADLEVLVGTRVTVCPGDLDQPGLGLTADDRARVVAECDSFLHCGASVRFDLPLAQARAVNLEGTRSVLALARERQRAGILRRVDHVSTAYVAGRREGRVHEEDLLPETEHRNSYERTKFEAEQLVIQARDEMPITTYRPSIVVGESDFGRTSNFNTLYWPVKVYATGYWRTLPGRRDTLLDVIPVDFVRDAILALRRKPRTVGSTFHLVAGPTGALSIGEAIELVERLFPERRDVRVVNPERWMATVHPLLKAVSFGQMRRFLGTVESYVPYLMGNPVFDNTRTREMLEPMGISVPSVSSYFDRLMRYCIETDWGRIDRPKSREPATARVSPQE